VVPVFGQVGQVAEVGEGADHAHRAVAAQALEQLLQRLVGRLVGVAAERHRELADLLDQVVRSLAFLLADHIAQDATEQADVVDQGLVLVGPATAPGRVDGGCGAGRRSRHGGGRCGVVGRSGKRPC
jgi:succinyl-CoA synthetase alpha subunit